MGPVGLEPIIALGSTPAWAFFEGRGAVVLGRAILTECDAELTVCLKGGQVREPTGELYREGPWPITSGELNGEAAVVAELHGRDPSSLKVCAELDRLVIGSGWRRWPR